MNPAYEEAAEMQTLALIYYLQFHRLMSVDLLSFLNDGLVGAIR